MRIISGKYKGRKIRPPKGLPVRPTTDFAKEALFNIIENNFNLKECAVLDLFCGTGNLIFEFASRETQEIIGVEQNHRNVAFTNKMLKELEISNVKIFKADVFRFLKKGDKQFDIIFADPPYDLKEITSIPDFVFERDLLKERGWLIIEHSQRTDFSKMQRFQESRRYGNVNFSIFS